MSAYRHLTCGSLIFFATLFSSSARCEKAHVALDVKNDRILITARVAKQNVYEQLKGAIEYVACTPSGKQYESLFVCDVDPAELVKALKALNLEPGRPAGIH